MTLAILAVVSGLIMLAWSADRFVDGAATTARYFGVPPLLIGMLIIGFGTSAPELMVSGLAALQQNPGIALGNAYGSNITNIALILGITAVISPITVFPQVLRKELLVLAIVTGVAVWQLWDGALSHIDAVVMLAFLTLLISWTIHEQRQAHPSPVPADGEGETPKLSPGAWAAGIATAKTSPAEHGSCPIGRPMAPAMGQEADAKWAGAAGLQPATCLPPRLLDDDEAAPIRRTIFWLITDLALLVVSSRMLVWGAVEIAHGFGVSDLIIGLTIVAIGTSLPELASSISAARKGEHDLALGNVIGSNLFNTLGVVGLAAVIQPMAVEQQFLHRDLPAVCFLTLSLFALGYRFGKPRPGRINRLEGCMLLTCYAAYTIWLIRSAFGQLPS
ncbi:MAG: calcium/sodium antiporter [Lautropia sp.]|nr:calcium/sodium antiporter [Lautropia sp.]